MPVNSPDYHSALYWKKTVLLFIIGVLCWYTWSGMMLHHVFDSPFHYKGADPAYWLLDSTGIPEMLTSAYGHAQIFTILLMTSFVAALIFHRKNWPVLAAGMLLLVYQIVFNMKIGYHAHHLFGLQFALFPFYFTGTKYFQVSVSAARLMACATYATAGLFKLKGGAWLLPDSFVNTLQNQHAAFLYFGEGSFRVWCIHFMLTQPVLLWLMFLSAMLLQLSFAAGFFTRKFDRILAIFILIFHLMDWFLMNLGVFMAMTIMCWLFLYKADKATGHHNLESSVTA